MATKLLVENILHDELREYANYGHEPDFLYAEELTIMGEMGMKDNRIELILEPHIVSDIMKYKASEMESDTISMLLTRGQARVIGEFLISLSQYKHDGERL